jgi:hypothetical protein
MGAFFVDTCMIPLRLSSSEQHDKCNDNDIALDFQRLQNYYKP